jgi:hypothetical protein
MTNTCACGQPVHVVKWGQCKRCYGKHYYRTQIAGTSARRPAYVYFVEAVGSDRIKIGKTRAVDARLQQLQVTSPFKLRILKVIRGGVDEDLRWHDRFKHLRVHGEWFHLDPELTSAKQQAEPAPDYA